MINGIVEKIKKLLSLAHSDNEHEAKMATQKANELLIKHNLSLQEVVDKELEYGSQNVKETGLTLKPHQKMIAQLLQEFFFVKVVINRQFVGESSGQWAYYRKPRNQYKKIVQLVGTKENSEIASYIFSYLNEAYPKLWEKYKADNEVTHLAKTSYFHGLTQGIRHMLNETKWRVQQETGLVLVKDKKLEDYVKKITNGSYGGQSDHNIDPEVYRDGVEDGKKIQLKKPIESKAENNGKFLPGKKENKDE